MSKREVGETSQQGSNAAAAPSSSTATTTTTTRVRAPPDPLLVACGCFSFVTVVASILCITVNVISALRSFKNGSDVFDGVFRCYAVLIAIFVVVAETEWEFIIKFWKVLEYWAGRGMLQILSFWGLIFCKFAISVAVMTRAYSDTSGERKELLLLQNIASYMLMTCGLVYVISGVLCIGFLKRTRQKKEISTGKAIKDLQDLERRREELEALLIVERV